MAHIRLRIYLDCSHNQDWSLIECISIIPSIVSGISLSFVSGKKYAAEAPIIPIKTKSPNVNLRLVIVV